MKDRAFATRGLLKSGALWVAALLLSLHVTASASLLTAGVDLGAAGRTKDWAVFTLGGCDSSLSGNGRVEGNFGVAGNGGLDMSGKSVLKGDLSLRNIGALDISGKAEILGGTYFNTSTKAVLSQGALDAERASQAAFNLSTTAGYPRELNANQSLTLNGNGLVVLKLSDFELSGNAALTLKGTANTTFVFNVKEDFSLSGNSKIKLTGGLTWDNVLFNVRGGGLVSLSGNSQLEGILLATQRSVDVSGNAQVRGQIIASNVSISGNAVVSRPPTVSP